MTGRDPDLLAAVEAWAATDVDLDDATLTLATAHGHGEALESLRDAWTGPLQFGTAGLRGAMGPGPNRMNRSVVVRAAAGLGAYLLDRVGTGVRPPLVVVGHDARHRSAAFATDSAAVLVAAGCRVVLLSAPLPTPVLAHAVRRLGADAGVMVTASHNPKDDNGYKVYLGGRVSPGPGDGVQIVPPADRDIAARIAAAPAPVDVPRAGEGWEVADASLVDGYVAAVVGLLPPGPRELRVVTTAMHGVGQAVLGRVLAEAGVSDVTPVPEQAEPDPDFPTVPFPNPEEAGALDLALTLAARTGAELVVAVDPDADRCSIAVADPARGPADEASSWRQLSGDEVGALLVEHVLTRDPAPVSCEDDEPPTVACSLVSGSLLHRIAAAHGVRSAATLTGFKWIARVPGLVMGYEEAIGYCVAPSVVRDKDGISTALLLVELAAAARARGESLLDRLDALALAHGVHLTAPVTLRVDDMSVVWPVLARLVASPPTDLAGTPVTAVEDLAAGVDGLPATTGVRLTAGPGASSTADPAADVTPVVTAGVTAATARVVVRPSGTEPKLKAYLEVVEPAGDDLAQARAAAAGRMGRLQEQVSMLLG